MQRGRLTRGRRSGKVLREAIETLCIETMSTENLPAAKTGLNHQKIVVVAATYNEKYTTPLLQNCLDELKQNAPGVEVEVVRVPGAFEVPVMVNRAIHQPAPGSPTPAVVIALGVILRGSTAHADLIGSSITQELLRTACSSLTPVIHEVLLLNDEQQAEERCIGERLNRGTEAGRAAVAMLNLLEAQGAFRV